MKIIFQIILKLSNILKHILDHDILYIDIGRFVNSLPNSQGHILWCQHFVLMLPKRQCSNLLGNFSKLTLIAYWKLTFFYIKNILYCKENFRISYGKISDHSLSQILIIIDEFKNFGSLLLVYEPKANLIPHSSSAMTKIGNLLYLIESTSPYPYWSMTAMLASSENDDLSPSVSTKPGSMLTTFTPVPFNSCLKSTKIFSKVLTI